MSLRALLVVVTLGTVSVTAWSTPMTTSSPAETIRFLGLETRMPATWVRGEPSSSMRLAQFSAREPGTGEAANVVFYYFGRGQGGSHAANIARWQSQFQGDGGLAVEPVVERFDVGEIPVTLATFKGSYARSIGMGSDGGGKPDQALVAAMLDTAEGMVVVQLYGDVGFVESLVPGFVEMLRAIEPVAE